MGDSGLYPSKNFEYDILLKVKDGKYFLEIKELYIVSSGDDIEEVYKTVVAKEKEVRDEYEMRGALDDLPAPIATPFFAKDSGSEGYAPSSPLFWNL